MHKKMHCVVKVTTVNTRVLVYPHISRIEEKNSAKNILLLLKAIETKVQKIWVVLETI